MQDRIGIILQGMRNKAVLPFINGDLLDVACGTNTLCQQYKKKHPDRTATGADVYPWDGVDVIIENSGNLPFDDASFDTVTCVAAINHIPERNEFLREAIRVLRPNGKFIATMIPPKTSRVWHFLRSPWDVDQHERGMDDGEVFGFTRAQMKSMLLEHGFHSITLHPFMLCINTVYVAARPDK